MTGHTRPAPRGPGREQGTTGRASSGTPRWRTGGNVAAWIRGDDAMATRGLSEAGSGRTGQDQAVIADAAGPAQDEARPAQDEARPAQDEARPAQDEATRRDKAATQDEAATDRSLEPRPSMVANAFGL